MYKSAISKKDIKIEGEILTMEDQFFMIQIFDNRRFDFIYKVDELPAVEINNVKFFSYYLNDDEVDTKINELIKRGFFRIEDGWLIQTEFGHEISWKAHNYVRRNWDLFRTNNELDLL